jgi:nondiscriminating aspartyl-tRNA synthetase
MQRILIKELNNHLEKEVYIKGWVDTIRNLGKIMFVIVRDRSGLVQVVTEDEKSLKELGSAQPGTVVYVKGKVSPTKATKEGLEIIEPSIEVKQLVSDAWPIEINKEKINASLETMLDYRPISLRHKRSQAIFRIQAKLVEAYREYLIKNDFVEFFGPTIISASSEGGTELFKVNYFDDTAMLSQSAQLYKQMMVGVYERVFALMKCYRAEKSNTRRHLTEATQFEFEMGFIENYSEIMDMLENTIKYMIGKVRSDCKKELEVLNVELAKAPENVRFPRVTFKDALEIFFKRTGIDERNEIDLSPGAEGELCKYAREEFGTDFIFVTNFLRKKTAFYAMPNDENPEVTNYFDLLCREVEIVSGGQRINTYNEMAESLKLKGLNPEDFQDYLSIFKYGMPLHGGFGMGMERFTMMLLGLENIRECTLFPSDPKMIASVRLATKMYAGKDMLPEIINRLKVNNFEYKLVEHKEVTTSEEASTVRDTKMEEGVKAIILRGKNTNKNIMVCVPANQKIDLKLLKDLESENFEFEKEDAIKSKYGLEVGGIPPFGNLLGLTTYFQKSVLDEKRAAFNCGYKNRSIIMNSKDLTELVKPIMIG